MAFTLEDIVPWGRSYQEYVDMFGLTEADLQSRLLGCGDGPASFNAILTQRGGRVVSIDPLYAFNAAQIRSRIHATYDTVIEQVRKNQQDFVWHTIPSVDDLGKVRMQAMDEFLDDYAAGKKQQRYIVGKLPVLPFAQGSFDIALSSHFLFLYSDHLSEQFHVQAVLEMLRVARQVRVFPLLTLAGKISPYITFVKQALVEQGFSVDIRRIAYEFQRGGNEILVIDSVATI